MKRILCLVLAVVLALSVVLFAGCGKEETKSSSTSKSSSSKASVASGVEVIELDPMSAEMQAVADKFDIKEYRCTGLEYEYIVFVVKNNSDTDCGFNVVVNFYNKNKTLVDCQEEEIEALGAGQTSAVAVYANEKFESYTSDVAATELTYYTAITKDLKLKVEENDSKLNASVTNNGKKTACFTTVNSLFFKGDEIYDFDKSYVGDDNSEIAPGKTETKEIFKPAGCDRYEQYVNSYAKAED
ncbi:MAG: hypothetical protein K6F88_06630 [Ruminococcus sp.]|nr:hypothetical protein [Ruminococcus sp.]